MKITSAMYLFRLIIIISVMLAATVAFSQTASGTGNPGSGFAPAGIIFQENFDGLTALPPTWTVYKQDSWDMIVAQNDEVLFFKQSAGVKTLILSTPSIDLTTASQMTFSFSSPKALTTLKIGLMSDPMNPATFQLLTQFQADSAMITYTVPMGGISGSHYVSFNWVGQYFNTGYLDNVIIYDNASQNNVPSNVANLMLVANPLGASAGTLSWTNPSLEADGDPLTDLDSIVVKLNGTYYSTLMNPTIGAPQSMQINVPQPGLYSATLIPYNSTGEGISNVSNEIWIGLDMPAAPRNVILTQVNNNVNIKWSPPDSGAHGGYFNGIVTQYMLQRADGWQVYVPGTDTSYSGAVTDPGTFNYKVIPENPTGSGLIGVSNTGVFLTGNYLLWEDFWVEVPAFQWAIQGENEYNWWLNHGSLAGGETPEMLFQGTSPYFFGYSRAVSPTLNTSGLTAVTLEFRQAHAAYGNYNFNVETSSDGGNTWHTGWSLPVTQAIPAEKQSIILTTGDVGSAGFMFAFTFQGSEANLESFSIDDVRLSPTIGTDIAANSLLLPEVIQPGQSVTPKAIVQSLSVNSANYLATYLIKNTSGILYSDTIRKTVPPGSIDTLSFKNWISPEGEFGAAIQIQCAADNNPVNDTVTRNFVSYQTYNRELVVLEEATGTWCTYCPGAAMGIEDLLKNGYKVAAIAYHGGDIYENPVSRARLDYYPAITGYPTVMFDGTLSYVGGEHSISMYNNYVPLVEQRLVKPAYAKVSLAQDILFSGNTLSAQVNIQSLSPVRNENLVLHAALTESKIPEAWQDMTELNALERFFFADSTGTAVDLSDKSEQVAVQYTIDPSWELENLELIVFLQDKVTKEIINGAKGKPSVGISEFSESGLQLFPNPAASHFTIRGIDKADIAIYDLTGMVVLETRIGDGENRIGISSLENGFYMVKVLTGKKATTLRLVVLK
jgi:hypothetical protein